MKSARISFERRIQNPFGGLAVAKPGHPTEFLQLFLVPGYFSLATLSTIGFGASLR